MRRQGAELTLPTNPAGGDIAAFLRVRLNAGVLAVAGITDNDFLGTMIRRYVSAGLGKSTVAAVLSRNAEGSRMCIANGAIAVGAAVFTAAGGKVGATATTAIPYGVALSTSTADGDEIEVLTYGGYPAEV